MSSNLPVAHREGEQNQVGPGMETPGPMPWSPPLCTVWTTDEGLQWAELFLSVGYFTSRG